MEVERMSESSRFASSEKSYEGVSHCPAKVIKHEHIVVWQRTVALARWLSGPVLTFPASDDHRLSEQIQGVLCRIRRASALIPSEAAQRETEKGVNSFALFLHVTREVLPEIEQLLAKSGRLGYISPKARHEAKKMIADLRRLLPVIEEGTPGQEGKGFVRKRSWKVI